jgi:hypothetical protein
MLFEAFCAFRAPHVPKFVDISTTTALDVLITSIIFSVVKFILLEEIGGI